jgi:hypothetical protein
MVICDDTELVLPLIVTPAGLALTYKWYHNGELIKGANTDTYRKLPPFAKADEGEYYVVVSGGNICGEYVSITVNVTIQKNIIGQKWDDVLYVDNSKDSYTSYNWYRVVNGEKHLINGEHKQYFSETPLNGTYMVEGKNKTKNITVSCPFTPTVTTKNVISIYPNPVSQSGTLTVYMDMERDLISGSVVSIYDMIGKQVRTQVVDGQTTSITMQHIVPGTYVVRITSASGETLKSEKVIVQ